MASPVHGRVVVFEPSPIFTVTIEREAGRPPEVHFHLGGQGAWIGRVIRMLGGQVVLCGALGGETGAVLRALATDDRSGIQMRSIACANANGGYVHDRRDGRRSVIVDVPSPVLTRHETDDLYSLALEEASRSDVLVLTGLRGDHIIPLEIFRRLPRDIAALGCKVVADLDRRTLPAFGGPLSIAKVSHLDLIEGRPDRRQTIFEAALALQARGADNVVVSHGADAIVCRLGQRWLEVCPPPVGAVDPRGGGDSMTGALAFALSVDLDPQQGLRLAAAAGAANATRRGLGSGIRTTIEELARRVEVRPLHKPGR